MQPWIELGVLTATVSLNSYMLGNVPWEWPTPATMGTPEGSGGMPPTQPVPGA